MSFREVETTQLVSQCHVSATRNTVIAPWQCTTCGSVVRPGRCRNVGSHNIIQVESAESHGCARELIARIHVVRLKNASTSPVHHPSAGVRVQGRGCSWKLRQPKRGSIQVQEPPQSPRRNAILQRLGAKENSFQNHSGRSRPLVRPVLS